MSTPLVSIICLTYNQAPFIRQCLDGFVMQKADFSFEVLIHDDASTDGTTDIVREYAERFPSIILPFYEEENQFGKRDVCRDIMFPHVRGKYVAFCEGDDYWTDPEKLQKQVDALEAYPEAAVCFHPVTVHWEDGVFPDSEFPSPDLRFNKNILELSDLLKHNFIQTNSVMYRWRFHSDPGDLIPDNILPGDWFLHLLHAQIGTILFLPDNMGVYRRYKGSLWYECMKTARWFKRCGIPHYRFYEEVEKTFMVDFSDEKRRMLLHCYAHAMVQHDDNWLKMLRNMYPVDANEFQHLRWKFFLLSIVVPFIRGKKKVYLRRKKRDCKELLKIFSKRE